mmetsp:Transcript_11235/g.46895  ORF Transcript_11235/g.46895 Transcript_11235/m.46895 type:complete len:219 (-) Transcript_11235:1074-1730(-)
MVVAPEPHPLPLHVRDVVPALHRPAVHHHGVKVVLGLIVARGIRGDPVPVSRPERRRRAVGPHAQHEGEGQMNVNLTTDHDGVPDAKTAFLRPGLAHEAGLEPLDVQHERGGKSTRSHLLRLDPRRVPAPPARERLVHTDVLGPRELTEARLQRHRTLPRPGRVPVRRARHVQRQAHRRVVNRGCVSARAAGHLGPEHTRERRVHGALTLLHQHRPAP